MAEAVATNWYENAGDFLGRFERAFASYTGRRHAVALPSCTSGIHLALAALGVGPGDEVIVPEATWIATAAPVSYVGATPVFADIDPLTWCLDPDSVRASLSARTRAIIAVDLYGGMPDMAALQVIATEAGVVLIEDAAEAVGSRWCDAPAGSFGEVSVFSFHGSKTLTTGEGGMVLTSNSDLYDRMLVLRDHGRRPGDVSFFNQEVAFKYRMSAIQAALGLAQLERLDELVCKKREIFQWYARRLDGAHGITLNAEPRGTFNSYWMVTVLLDRRHDLLTPHVLDFLRRRGISTRPFFHPLSSLPAYRDTEPSRACRGRNPVSYDIGDRAVNLPSALLLHEADVDTVCDAVLALVRR